MPRARGQEAAALRKKLRKIDTAENAHAREIEQLAHLDASAAAVSALRSRIIARFTELEEERAQPSTQLADLEKTTPEAGDPSLLDKLPILGDILTGAPTRLQQLHAAFSLQIVYKRETRQVTIRAEITTSTPDTLATILDDHNGPQPAGATRTTGRTSTEISVSPRPAI